MQTPGPARLIRLSGSNYKLAEFNDGTMIRIREEVDAVRIMPADSVEEYDLCWPRKGYRRVKITSGMLLTDFLAVLSYLEGT